MIKLVPRKNFGNCAEPNNTKFDKEDKFNHLLRKYMRTYVKLPDEEIYEN